MNLKLFSLIILVFPLASIAASPVTSQNKDLDKPAGAKSLLSLKPVVPPSSIVINPTIKLLIPQNPKGPTYFKLSKVPNKNQLTLSFETLDPHLKLNVKDPMVIEFFTAYPLQINPRIVLGTMWPNNGTPLTLSYSAATLKIQNKISGKASYTYCHDLTHQCKTVLNPLLFYFIP